MADELFEMAAAAAREQAAEARAFELPIEEHTSDDPIPGCVCAGCQPLQGGEEPYGRNARAFEKPIEQAPNYSMLVDGETIATSACRDIITARARMLREHLAVGRTVSVWDCNARTYIVSETVGPETPQPVTAASVICADDVIVRLLELPEDIRAREEELIRAEVDVAACKALLQTREDELLIGGAHLIDGKNAETRAAQMRQATSRERDQLAEGEDYARRVRAGYHRTVNEFSALKAVARLLEGGQG